MNRDEAKVILQSYRPNDQDRDDPRFAEALALSERDPELKRWFEEQRAFDTMMQSHLQAIPVPAGLKQKLLARPRIISLEYLWNWRPALAMAASLVLLAGGFAFWWKSRPVNFSVFAQEIASRSWDLCPHCQYETKDLAQVKAWLAGRDAESNFQIPAALHHAQIRGCSVVHWRGHQVPVLCMYEGPRHMHLLVAEELLVSGGPGENQPTLEIAGTIRTASWKSRDKTYVLTGFTVHAFVKKFRQAGHWQLSS